MTGGAAAAADSQVNEVGRGLERGVLYVGQVVVGQLEGGEVVQAVEGGLPQHHQAVVTQVPAQTQNTCHSVLPSLPQHTVNTHNTSKTAPNKNNPGRLTGS